jgi:hypothetical protein
LRSTSERGKILPLFLYKKPGKNIPSLRRVWEEQKGLGLNGDILPNGSLGNAAYSYRTDSEL